MKTLNNGDKAREEIKSGVDAVANHVKSTLGPEGRNVLIQRDGQSPIITKDGVTVANNIHFKPSLKQAGAEAIKEASARTASQAGDGTTTTCVIAQAIYGRGCSMLDNGISAYKLRKGIESATKEIVEEIKRQAKPISLDGDDIMNVALVSSNNDEIISKSITEAYKHVGADGSIVIDRSSNSSTFVELGDGCRFDKGMTDNRFANTLKGTVEFENCIIYVTDRVISKLDAGIVSLCQFASEQKSDLLIIAQDVNMESLYTLLRAKVNNGLRVCCVNAPSFINRQSDLIEDIAAYVGANVDSQTSGFVLYKDNTLQVDILGKANRVVITEADTMIIGGYSNKDVLDKRINSVIESMKENKDSVIESEYCKKRLSLLTGKSARIFAGGSSDVEIDERIDRIDDAIKSVKSAIEEGVVEGGGCCLYKIGVNSNEEDEIKNIVYKSIREPFYTILDNADLNKEEVISEWDDGLLGYNARARTFEPLLETGIIDSAKVVRCALENASSIATMLLTTNCTIENSNS